MRSTERAAGRPKWQDVGFRAVAHEEGKPVMTNSEKEN
jgi:hypothetical protein